MSGNWKVSTWAGKDVFLAFFSLFFFFNASLDLDIWTVRLYWCICINGVRGYHNKALVGLVGRLYLEGRLLLCLDEYLTGANNETGL